MKHEEYMQLAIELATKGAGHVSPNPLVGAVIVKDGEVIGQRYHEKYGGLHAEKAALENCHKNPMDGTMYVTLEPCSHFGKQPPCALAIIEAGIKTVYIGSDDPNPKVSGKGMAMLKEAGIEIIPHFLKSRCDELNEIFFHYIKTKKPYISLKYAMSLDGKIATYTGNSQWITGSLAREHVHKMRNDYTAIMVGSETVLSDNPMLNCRLPEGGVNPIRIVCDSRLRIPMDSNLVKTANSISTIIATCSDHMKKISELQDAGCQVLRLASHDEHIDLRQLIDKLGKMSIDSILIEGGGTLNWALMEAGLVNHIKCYVGSKILGGSLSKSPIAGLGFANVDNGPHVEIKNVERFQNDILIEADIFYERSF